LAVKEVVFFMVSGAVEGLPSGELNITAPVTGGGDLVCLFTICHNYKLLHLLDILVSILSSVIVINRNVSLGYNHLLIFSANKTKPGQCRA
jgi:hypothetical protein